eukprot:30813_1
MGNTSDAEHCGKLTVEEDPNDNESIPTNFNSITNQKCIDKRVRAKPDDYEDFDEKKMDNALDSKNAIYNIVQLRIKYSDTCMKIGSGVIIHHTINRAFVLTSANNIVQLNKANKHENNTRLDYAKSIWMRINKNTLNEHDMVNEYKCCNFIVHPKYIEFLKQSDMNESVTGYDIGMIEILDPKNELKNIEKVKIATYKSKTSQYLFMEIKVIGYDGKGELHGMKGNGEVRYMNDKIKYNKLISWNDIDTSYGQNGCPVFKVLSDEKHEENIYKSFGAIVGISITGNYGTLLNDEIIQWIYECVDGDCIEYTDDMCGIGVLLITSSKAKYAERLNQIHKKCVKTEIMSTRKLYYDYINEDTVSKKDLLFYIEEFFKIKRKSYLIFYCGESDENGNWRINNVLSDNITLNDIAIDTRWKCKDSKLIIVSDCSYSGDWVCLKNSNKIAFKNIDCIQASSEENHTCNAGTFTSKYSQCVFGYKKVDKMGGMGVAATVGGTSMAVLGALTVGTLYDGVVKQPWHKASKKSQPTRIWAQPVIIIGCSRDGLYEVRMSGFDSWYAMDLNMTVGNSGTVGSAGARGYY